MKFIKLALGLVLISILVYHLEVPFELFKRLTVWQWLVLLGLALAVIVTVAFVFYSSMKCVYFKVDALNAFVLSAANNFYNTVLPMKAGFALRALYMKKVLGLSYTAYLKASALAQIQVSVIPFAVIALMFGFKSEVDLRLLIAGLVVLVFFSSFVLNATSIYLRQDFDARFVYVLGQLSLLAFLITSIRFLFISEFSLLQIDLSKILILVAIISVSSLVQLTPGNLGVREGLLYISSSYVGIDEQLVVVLALIDRLASLVISVLFGGISALYLFHQIQRRQLIET